MKVLVAKDYDAMSKATADLVEKLIKEDPDCLVSFPGGDTPVGLVKEFCARVNNGAIDPSTLKFVQLDDWVGLGPDDKGCCSNFIRDSLLTKMDKPFAEVFTFDGSKENIDEQLASQDAFIVKHGNICVEVLGIGMNGHLGFNEDGVDFSLRSHRQPLSVTTKGVQSKYFDGKDLPLTEGITQGIAQIMESKTVIVIANGEKKAEIVSKAITGPVTNQVPASVLQGHPNCYYLLDEGAAKLLPAEMLERV